MKWYGDAFDDETLKNGMLTVVLECRWLCG